MGALLPVCVEQRVRHGGCHRGTVHRCLHGSLRAGKVQIPRQWDHQQDHCHLPALLPPILRPARLLDALSFDVSVIGFPP